MGVALLVLVGGGRARRAHAGRALAAADDDVPAVSPDGGTLASEHRHALTALAPYCEIATTPITGGEPRPTAACGSRRPRAQVRSGRWPCSEPSSWPLTDGSEADYPTNETETAVDASLASLRRAVEEESPATAIAGAVTAVLAGWRRLERDSPYRTVVTGLFLLIVTVPPCRGVRGNRGHRL